ncbi:helix-turn-helix domain-containing protein [Ligaoa zhengdingensis]|uniref:helix-turn-helix domain-containing protein n=1 Tax=Ligaoa zhengdingensis TaxID=2763658 RepID=UPI003CCEE862
MIIIPTDRCALPFSRETRKAKVVRFSTLDAICRALGCQPGDLLEWNPNGEEAATDIT